MQERSGVAGRGGSVKRRKDDEGWDAAQALTARPRCLPDHAVCKSKTERITSLLLLYFSVVYEVRVSGAGELRRAAVAQSAAP